MLEKILKKIKTNTPMVLITVGVFFIVISTTHWILRFKALSLDANLIAQYIDETDNDQNNPVHIKIQWFIDTDIEKHVFINDNWTISENNASYLSNSSHPGEPGNIIIYGHNKRSILGNIRALKGDETITITTLDGAEHLYKISQIAEVDPSETQFLQPTDEETLTIYTCSGFLDKKRFIVQAKPVVSEINSEQSFDQKSDQNLDQN